MEKEMGFETAVEKYSAKLGDWKIMALASCVDNYPMVRNVSCLFYNDKIYFKTDKNFRKTQQLYANPRRSYVLQRYAGRRHRQNHGSGLWKKKAVYSRRNIKNFSGSPTMPTRMKTPRFSWK